MLRRTLLGSLILAAMIALGLVPFLLMTQSLLGTRLALSIYTLGSTALYVYWSAASARSGLMATLIASLLLTGVLLLSDSRHELMLGAAVVLALCRSGILYRSRFYRALFVEASLLGGSLLFAFELAGATTWSLAWSLWGFYLVQSLYQLVAGKERQTPFVSGDAFSDARTRALSIIEEPLV